MRVSRHIGKAAALVQVMLAILLGIASTCRGSDSQATTWLGTSPFCAVSSRDCDILGLTYLRSDVSGDGLSCLSGEKVLCAAPGTRREPAKPDRLSQFTVIQYNLMDRPYWVGHEGQRERMCRIPQALARHIAAQEHVDALVLNESFSGKCTPNLHLRDMLAKHGWSHYLHNISSWWKPSNGGIFIASKWPIAASQNLVYSACRFPDCLAAKGVQYARIVKTLNGRAKTYHIFGTHMQAWGGAEAAAVRSMQARDLARFIQQQDIPRTEPVLLAGDLNTRGPAHPQFQTMIDILGVWMPPIVGVRRATMDIDNTLFPRGPSWVDYVLPTLQHQRPLTAELEVIRLQTEQPFTICVEASLRPFFVGPLAAACAQTRQVQDLSDHYPVIGRFEYGE